MSGKNWKPCARDGCKNIGVSKGYCSWHSKQMRGRIRGVIKHKPGECNVRKNAKLVRVSASSLAKIEETSKLSRVPIEQVTDDAIDCGLLSEQFESIYGPMIEFRTRRNDTTRPSEPGMVEEGTRALEGSAPIDNDGGAARREAVDVPISAALEGVSGVSFGNDPEADHAIVQQRFEGTGDDGLGLAYRPD